MEINRYKISDSRKGFWRNGRAPLVLRYVRNRFGSRFRSHSCGTRSQSQGAKFGRKQSKSQDRPKSDLTKKVEFMEVKIKETKGLIIEMKEYIDKRIALETNFVEKECGY